MHITPEEGSSYASFETNQKVASYSSLINNVVRTFKPKRFVMTLMADEGGLRELKEHPFGVGNGKGIVVPAGMNKIVYKRSNLASIQVEEDTCCLMGNWVADEDNWATVINEDRSRSMSFAW